MKNKLNYLIGIFFLFAGVYLAVFQQEPHFYTFFSIGMVIVLYEIYKSTSKKQLFVKWKTKDYFLFAVILIIICMIIDRLGLFLGYWTDLYFLWYDIIIKYVFEWAVAFLYVTLALLIGIEFFRKARLNYPVSFILSLLIFVTLAGIFTEFFNHFANSWIVLKMPFTNYKMGDYFIIFQTIGYWIIAVIPLSIYKIIDKIK